MAQNPRRGLAQTIKLITLEAPPSLLGLLPHSQGSPERSAPTAFSPRGGPRVRISFPPAESHQRTIARRDRHRSPPSLRCTRCISRMRGFIRISRVSSRERPRVRSHCVPPGSFAPRRERRRAVPWEAPRARSRNGAGRYLAPDARQDGNEIEFLSREVFSGGCCRFDRQADRAWLSPGRRPMPPRRR
jgi:hypothetical protein